MAKTNAERVLDYLFSVGPKGATNADIRIVTKIEPHQQVYTLTQDLKRRGLINARRDGKEWIFYINNTATAALQSPGQMKAISPRPELNSRQFEDLARKVFSDYFGVPLNPGQVKNIPKLFDLVSPDGSIVGDVKYLTLVGGKKLPPAKFSMIAEHVWLLEKTQAKHQFLVFGNDIEVPKRWLDCFGHLRAQVSFYYLGEDEKIIRLEKLDT